MGNHFSQNVGPTTGPKSYQKYDWLGLSAKLWFIITAVGQWLFVVYIIGYYGARYAGDGLKGFDGTHLANGFITGDHIGNTILAIHVLVAGMTIAAGQIQLIPNIRCRIPRLHRYSGWFFMLSSVMVSAAGIYLVWSRDRVIGSLVQDIGVTLGGVLAMAFVPVALYYAIKRDIAKHRQWALRLFMVVSAVWFLRLMTFAWFIATGGIGIDMESFSGPFLYVAHFAQYILPLAVLELYFRAQETKVEFYRKVVAVIVILMSLTMAVGIVGASVFSWFPRLVA